MKAEDAEGSRPPTGSGSEAWNGMGKLFGFFKSAPERRARNHRRDVRYAGAVERAVVLMAGTRASVRVLNISERGAQIKSPLQPDIGESVVVEFDGFAPMRGVVRWVKGGRIGIALG